MHERSENKGCNVHVRIPIINLNIRIFLERSEDKNRFSIDRIDSSSASLYIVRMAEEVLIKIKQVNECNALAFVEREKPYLNKTLKEIRPDIVREVGELLPRNFKFVRMGIPVSCIQEEKLSLEKCVEEEGGTMFNCSIQVNSVEENYVREISTQSSGGKKSNLFVSPSAVKDGHDAFEKTRKQVEHNVETLADEIQMAQARLQSLEDAPSAAREWYGRANFTCKNCHYKGHKITKPCNMPACRGYECGILAMHPEQKVEINKAKKEPKTLTKKLKVMQDEKESIDLMKGRTRANFLALCDRGF